jgi:Rps23 Pro-64 3,4-dihydroxylase Tpa1-like proline 4-hydroxylase
MIDLNRIDRAILATEPWNWVFIDDLFAPGDAGELARNFPRDRYKTVAGYDGEKGYEYEAREFIGMGASTASHADALAPAWQRLARDLLSPAYRESVSLLVSLDVTSLPVEVNTFHYGPGSWLGPHVDLKDKLVTHVLYFNEVWNPGEGGCLAILAAPEESARVRTIAPLVGNSALLVRSDGSWHEVSRVAPGCTRSRRSMTVTFYRPGSISTMWPPNDPSGLHAYTGPLE